MSSSPKVGSSPNVIRILAADDHALIRDGIAALIADQTDMRLVAEASSGREAIEQFRRHHPDVTLMDLQMPEMNGMDALIAIRSEFPEARIIVLTSYVGDALCKRAMKAPARKLIRYDERQFRLRVRDDGKGIDSKLLDEDERHGHYGMRGMRERAELLGGKMTVWSQLDSGTEVELSIPAAKAYATPDGRKRSWLPEKLAWKLVEKDTETKS
jgi:CheY-like chemotaxis protein